MCFVWIWEQTAIISLYSINWLVFITETECVYCAVRTGYLYRIYFKFSLSWGYKSIYVWYIYAETKFQNLNSYSQMGRNIWNRPFPLLLPSAPSLSTTVTILAKWGGHAWVFAPQSAAMTTEQTGFTCGRLLVATAYLPYVSAKECSEDSLRYRIWLWRVPSGRITTTNTESDCRECKATE